VRAVRISTGERYFGDCVPEKEFARDPADAACKAVLTYDSRFVEGGWATDVSGNGNDGKLDQSLQ